MRVSDYLTSKNQLRAALYHVLVPDAMAFISYLPNGN
jgi:hypothetical protein